MNLFIPDIKFKDETTTATTFAAADAVVGHGEPGSVTRATIAGTVATVAVIRDCGVRGCPTMNSGARSGQCKSQRARHTRVRTTRDHGVCM